MTDIAVPSSPSSVSAPVRLTSTRPGSRSRRRVVISAARVVLPVPPIPCTTIPASCALVRSAGQRRCSRRRPTKYQSSRAASPAIRGRDGCDTAAAVWPGSRTGTDPDAASTVTAAHSPSPASSLSRRSAEVSSSVWTWRRASERALTTSGSLAWAKVP